jgi:hypothetical protein
VLELAGACVEGVRVVLDDALPVEDVDDDAADPVLEEAPADVPDVELAEDVPPEAAPPALEDEEDEVPEELCVPAPAPADSLDAVRLWPGNARPT